MIVDLPDPVVPIIANFFPLEILKETFLRKWDYSLLFTHGKHMRRYLPLLVDTRLRIFLKFGLVFKDLEAQVILGVIVAGESVCDAVQDAISALN